MSDEDADMAFAWCRDWFNKASLGSTFLNMALIDAEAARVFGRGCEKWSATPAQGFTYCMSIDGRVAHVRALMRLIADRNVPTSLDIAPLASFIATADRFLERDLNALEALLAVFTGTSIDTLNGVKKLIGVDGVGAAEAEADGDAQYATACLAEFLHNNSLLDGATVQFTVQAVVETDGYAVMMRSALRLPRSGALLPLRGITEDSHKRQHAAAFEARSERILESLVLPSVH
jgi:hypothetical protein